MREVLVRKPPQSYVSDDVAFGEPAVASAESTTTGETNVQVAGVDEMDTSKADGNFIYSLQTNSYPTTLLVIQRFPAADAKVLQKITFEDDYVYPTGIFVTSDQVIVLKSGYFSYTFGELDGSLITQVFYYERGSDGKLSKQGVRKIDGSLLAARVIDKKLHLVLSNYVPTPEGEDIVLPATAYGDDTVKLAGCTDIYHEKALTIWDDAPYSRNLVCVVSADTENPSSQPSKSCALTNSASVVYASKNNFFIAGYGWTEKAPIHQFALADSDNSTEYVGSALVNGWINNQFSMDEHEGFFRVASSSAENELAVFKLGGGDPQEVGKITGFASGESIYAVRFLGDKAFVVTFLQVDPLFAIDLSDPTHPAIRGELKVPGFSTYLHPMQEGYLLAVGQEGQDMAMSLFDVRSLTNLKLVDKVLLGNAYSESQWDHKAFRFDSESGLVILPMDIYTYEGPGFSGFKLYKADAENGFSQVGSSLFPDGAYSWGARAFVRDGGISLVGGGELVTRSTSDPNEDIARISIE
jgi:inhibitor of cysteine peptidase